MQAISSANFTAAARREKPGLALAVPVERPPDGEEWLHEIKYDGYRLAVVLESGGVTILTRSGLDWTARFPQIATAAARVGAEDVLLDGEAVAITPDGRPDFSLLQAVLAQQADAPLLYQAFDLLRLGSRDLRRLPLEERKAALSRLLEAGDPVLRFSGQLDQRGGEVFEHACRLGIEGIVSKRKGSPYQAGRSGDWLKSVCLQTGDFVVIGFSEPQGSRNALGALLLAERDAGGKELKFVGRVGTGFSEEQLRRLLHLLEPLARERSPLSERLTAAERRGVTWVEPVLVVEVSHSGRTGQGRLRHARFRYLREDKPAAEASSNGNRPRKLLRTMESTMNRNDRSQGSQTATVAGVTLSNPQRVMYAGQGITKLELAEYYEAVGEEQLRWLRDRPLALVRCPEGEQSSCFYQKHPGTSFAAHVPRIDIEEKAGEVEQYMLVREATDVIALVQAGVLEIHAWGSTAANLEQPDLLVFDLDPDEAVPYARLKQHARQLRDLLSTIGLTAFPRATGGKGIHLVVPIEPDTDFAQAKEFSKAVATELARQHPEQLTVNMSKAKRKGRVFIDYLRNGRGATAITNWSTRARPGAPVAVPVSWSELSGLHSSARWKPDSALRRLRSQKNDPWAGFEEARRSLQKVVAP